MGSLLAVPVRTAEVIAGVLVADRLEIQSFTGSEPALLESFAALVAEGAGLAVARGAGRGVQGGLPALPEARRPRSGGRGSRAAPALRPEPGPPRRGGGGDGGRPPDPVRGRGVPRLGVRVRAARGGPFREDMGGLGAPECGGSLPPRQRGLPPGPDAHPRPRRGSEPHGIPARGPLEGAEPHPGRPHPHRAPRLLRRGLAPGAGDPGQPGRGHRLPHQRPRAAEGAGGAGRPHQPLQPTRVQRAPGSGGGARRPAGRGLVPSSTTPTATRRETRPCAPPRACSPSTSARGTRPRATGARSSW